MDAKTKHAHHMTDAPSGFRQLVGYKLSEWTDGAATVTLTIGPRHLNRSGVLHGGVLTTIMDATGGYAGCYCPHKGRVRRSVTVSLTTQFMGQVKKGTITVSARLRGGGKRIFIADAEAKDSEGNVIAIGQGVYRYRSGSENTEGVPLEENAAGEKRNTDLG
jgi:uncharacterized protein (TIGR00369 family)